MGLVTPENVPGPVGDTFSAAWGRGGLLDPALWAQGTQPAAPVAPFGTMGVLSYHPVPPMPPTASTPWLQDLIYANRAYPTSSRPFDTSPNRGDRSGFSGGTFRGAGSPPATYRQAAAAASVPAPFPVPLPLPPVFIPGTPENKEFTDSTIRFYNWLKEGLTGGEGRNDDRFCQARWEAEVARCGRWQGRDKIGCHDRAAYRLRKCIRNGGRPDPEEPPEWSDADAQGWVDPRR